MAMDEKTSACPGGCRTQIDHKILCCEPCWDRLPVNLRTAVCLQYRGRAGYGRALREALTWFGNHSPQRSETS